MLNHNKHKHRGFPYLSYKDNYLKKKTHRYNFARECMDKYLRDFKGKFANARSSVRIDLLKEASYQKYDYDYNYYKNRHKKKRFIPINKPCAVCGSSPTIIHHIILLKNGGINKSRNYMSLCKLCHAKVHEWLLDGIAQELHDKMDQEYRAIVGLI